MHLQQQPPRLGAVERAAALGGHELGVDGEHGPLDQVRRRALAQGVDHLPLGAGALRPAARLDVREEGGSIAIVSSHSEYGHSESSHSE